MADKFLASQSRHAQIIETRYTNNMRIYQRTWISNNVFATRICIFYSDFQTPETKIINTPETTIGCEFNFDFMIHRIPSLSVADIYCIDWSPNWSDFDWLFFDIRLKKKIYMKIIINSSLYIANNIFLSC